MGDALQNASPIFLVADSQNYKYISPSNETSAGPVI